MLLDLFELCHTTYKVLDPECEKQNFFIEQQNEDLMNGKCEVHNECNIMCL